MVAMANEKRKPFTVRLARERPWIQAIFLTIWLGPFLPRLHNVCSPVFHCYSCPWAAFACPVGVLANFSALHVFPFIAIGTVVLVGGVLGSFVCGYACPFGFLQDLVGKIPTPKFVLPAWAGHVRYVVLIAFALVIPYLYGEGHPLFFCSLCPAGALEGAVPNAISAAIAGNEVVWPNAVKLVILGAVVVAMFFTQRPWCTLLCPLGAVYGLFNRASVFFLGYNREECKACDQCDALCKYGVLPEPGVNAARCIRCLDCTRCGAISVGSILGPAERTKAGTRTGTGTSQDR